MCALYFNVCIRIHTFLNLYSVYIVSIRKIYRNYTTCGVRKMKLQENNKAVFVYLSKADIEELGWKKGDSMKTCVQDGRLIIQKRGVPK